MDWNENPVPVYGTELEGGMTRLRQDTGGQAARIIAGDALEVLR